MKPRPPQRARSTVQCPKRACLHRGTATAVTSCQRLNGPDGDPRGWSDGQFHKAPACNPRYAQSLTWQRALARIERSGSVPLQGRAEVAMSSIPTITESQRWEDLAAIRAAVK